MTDYASFVESRIKDPSAILASLSADKVNLLHMMIGAVGEWHEYAVANTSENILEELGDMRFYLVGALSQLKLDWPSETQVRGGIVGDYLDAVKRLCIYGKEDQDISTPLLDFCCYVNYIIEGEELTISEIDAHNIAKLTKRYANKYTDAAAIDRKDKH